MLAIDDAIIGDWLLSSLLPFFRISGFLLVAPLFGTRLVPPRVRIIFALLLTAILTPHLPPVPDVDGISVAAFLLVIQQVLIGIAIGFVLQVLMQVFVVAGQLIAMQMGLGFAQMMDPANGVSVTVLSQFHLMLVTLLFVTMDGHIVMIEVLAESFYTLPVGGGFFSSNVLWVFASWLGWMFGSALLMALPALTALLIVNFSLGIITRASPQLNIFAVGFPFMIFLGLCILWATVGGYLSLFERFTLQALEMMRFMIR